MNAHHLCGLQFVYWELGKVSTTACLFVSLYLKLQTSKYLACAMDSCWNAASGILAKGERALPFFKGSCNWGNNLLEESCHCTLDVLDGSHRIPSGNGFSLAQLEM